MVSAFFAPVSGRLELRVGDVRDAAFWDGIAQDFAVSHLVHGAAVTSINRLTLRDDGSADMDKLLAGLQQVSDEQRNNGFELYKVGDAVSSRDIHCALLDSRRLCRAL